MEEAAIKLRVQKWILAASTLLLAGKFTAYLLTNSAGILTDAMESIVNVAAGAISLWCLRWGSRPKDKDHPFGHGKIELISASVEGLMISTAGVMIIFEGIRRLLNPVELGPLDAGIVIVALSGAVNWILGTVSIRYGKKYGSMALTAGGKHLHSDTWSTVGLVAGLLLVRWTGKVWVDSLLALGFGTIIIITGISILRKTVANLLDKADEQLLDDLAKTLNTHKKPQWIDIHNAKATKYGNLLHLDCDLTVPWYMTIEEGHREGEQLDRILQDKYSNRLQANIHLDPCNIFDRPVCGKCEVSSCQYRKEPFRKSEEITVAAFVDTEAEKDAASTSAIS